MLRAAAGRFGKFSETYQLPKDVDVDNMSATYDAGTATVIATAKLLYSALLLVLWLFLLLSSLSLLWWLLLLLLLQRTFAHVIFLLQVC